MNGSGKEKRSARSKPGAESAEDVSNVDALYGLEPVFEPESRDAVGDAPGSACFQAVQCPYCGETFETLVDVSSGSASYIEDCQVCCQPIEFRLDVDQTGALAGLELLRSA